MSIKSRKSKRIKIGFFFTEIEALEQIAHYKKYFHSKTSKSYTYHVSKYDRKKGGKPRYMAYALWSIR